MNVHNKNQFLKNHISNLRSEFILVDYGLCPDWSRGIHRRRRDSIYLILDGQGEITINGETIYPQKNNMVLLPKNSLVSLYSENETCYNKYWCEFIMHFDGISLFDVIDFPYMVEITDMAHTTDLFKRLIELNLRNDAASAFMVESILLELLASFLENDKRELQSAVAEKPFVQSMKAYINNHITEDLPIKKLAAEMCFNEKYFISVFKKNFGTTPALYIKKLKLEKAKHLLLYSDDKITYIINKIGYPSLQKFSKDFKTHTGFTPSEFRKKFF